MMGELLPKHCTSSLSRLETTERDHRSTRKHVRGIPNLASLSFCISPYCLHTSLVVRDQPDPPSANPGLLAFSRRTHSCQPLKAAVRGLDDDCARCLLQDNLCCSNTEHSHAEYLFRRDTLGPRSCDSLITSNGKSIPSHRDCMRWNRADH